MPTFKQWQQAWLSLGVSANAAPKPLYEQIIACFREPHRHYHTLQHLEECLEKLAELSNLAEHPAEIEFALWFHDAIYDPTRHDNERLSAEWAKNAAFKAGLPEFEANRIYVLVMATEHHAQPNSMDEKILVDADLAILAASPARFKEYENQIRAEYAFVPDTVFKAKRAEVLERFLARATLFNTDQFIARYEAQARANITQALSLL